MNRMIILPRWLLIPGAVYGALEGLGEDETDILVYRWIPRLSTRLWLNLTGLIFGDYDRGHWFYSFPASF